MVEELKRINVNTIGIERLEELGVDPNEVAVRAVNYVAKNALFSYQAKVPINTGELRDENIQISWARKGFSEARVYITDRIHEHSWGTDKRTNSYLALLLNSTSYNRSRQSEQASLDTHGFGTVGGFTEGWIELADAEFDTWLSGVDLSEYIDV